MVDFQTPNSDQICLIFLVVKHSDGRTEGLISLFILKLLILFQKKSSLLIVITKRNANEN